MKLPKLSSDLLVKLAFFYHNKRPEDMDFIEHKIREILEIQELCLLLRKLRGTELDTVSKKIQSAIIFRHIKTDMFKVFTLMHSLVRELNILTGIFEPHLIEYKIGSRNYIKKNVKKVNEINSLFKKRGKREKKLEFANKNFLMDKLLNNAFKFIMALHNGKIVGFSFCEPLQLEYEWPNIYEVRGLVIDPRYKGYGIGENLMVLGERNIIASTENDENVDYLISIVPSSETVTLLYLQKLGYKPIAIDIGGLYDYYGYTEPKKEKYSNFVFFINDFKKTVENSEETVYLQKEDYWFLKILYFFLGCRRKLIISEGQEIRRNKLEVIKTETGIIKSEGKGSYFVDLTRQDAPGVARYLKNIGFYLSGVLPVARKGEGRKDYAYYRYLSKDKPVSEKIFDMRYLNDNKFRLFKTYLQKRSIENFRQRFKNLSQ